MTPEQLRRALELAGLVEGAGDAAGQGASRLVDVRWAPPIWDGVAVEFPPDVPRDGEAFGGVRLTTARAGDWVVFAQPLRVTKEPNDFWDRPLVWTPSDEPGPWWPEDARAARSPFVLEVSAGPEGGVVQRFPIPALGLAVPLRGANVSATIKYDRGAIGTIPPPPYEAPTPQLGGIGRMQLVVTPGQPTSFMKIVQARAVAYGPIASVPLPGWLPAFSARAIVGQETPWNFTWLSPTNQVLASAFESQIPQAAVAMSTFAGDPPMLPRGATIEVFA